MEEVWKDVKGLEGLYAINSLGSVKSLFRKISTKDGYVNSYKERLLKIFISGSGYKFSVASKNGKRKTISIHVELAKCFIPNPNNHPCVNHINGNKLDNRLENLEWVSMRENTAHHQVILHSRRKASKYHGVFYKKDGNRNKRWGAILCLDKKLISLGYFLTEREAFHAYQTALLERSIQNKYAA